MSRPEGSNRPRGSVSESEKRRLGPAGAAFAAFLSGFSGPSGTPVHASTTGIHSEENGVTQTESTQTAEARRQALQQRDRLSTELQFLESRKPSTLNLREYIAWFREYDAVNRNLQTLLQQHYIFFLGAYSATQQRIEQSRELSADAKRRVHALVEVMVPFLPHVYKRQAASADDMELRSLYLKLLPDESVGVDAYHVAEGELEANVESAEYIIERSVDMLARLCARHYAQQPTVSVL